MITKTVALTLSLLLALVSAVLLDRSLPSQEIGWLAWIALVPLLVALSSRRKTAFLGAYVCGIVCAALVYDWIFEAPGYRLVHHAILALFIGMYTGVFGLIYGVINKRWNTAAALFLAPFIWVSMEYIRSHLSFLALPFPVLGHSQYRFLHLIQVSSITGAYGISFLLVAVNAAFSGWILLLVGRAMTFYYDVGHLPTKRSVSLLFIFASILTGLSVAYSATVLSRPAGSREVRISVIQGNIDKEKKLNTKKYAGVIMKRYTDLTLAAAKTNPDLIVWPEAATPGLVLKDLSLQQQLVFLIKKVNRHFLIGSSEYPKFSEEPLERRKTGNTALFFAPTGKLLGQYLKIFLIPFGEYIPYEKTVPWPEFIVPKGNRARDVPGNEFTLFEIDGAKFGVVICSEGAFPDLFRKFVKAGANFMLNITNEGWFGESALYQKVAASVFRAVENRVSLARATNTGISCFIDPHGLVYARVTKDNKETFVDGFLTRSVIISDDRTFYTRHGNLFAYANLVIVLTAMVLSLIFRIRK